MKKLSKKTKKNWLFWTFFVLIGLAVYAFLTTHLSFSWETGVLTAVFIMYPIHGFKLTCGMPWRARKAEDEFLFSSSVVNGIILMILFATSYSFWVWALISYGPKTLGAFEDSHTFFVWGLLPYLLTLVASDDTTDGLFPVLMGLLFLGFVGFLWMIGAPTWILMGLGWLGVLFLGCCALSE